ncbi:MAG: 2-isopropylmalate synthase [Myxococcota bacterium]
MQPYVRIFDTTLRDGEQSPGAKMTKTQKLAVAQALAQLGVDVIEAGFPAASPEDFAAVQNIASIVGRSEGAPSICGLARTTHKDIDRALGALEKAAKPRIHTFLATSPIHRSAKLRMSKQQVLDTIQEMVSYASHRCPDVEFSAEDAGRTEPEFLFKAVQAAIDAGAKTINIPDTVGYTHPFEYGKLIRSVLDEVPDAHKVILSVHCHDDLGLAVANTLAGLQAGARQAEVTINGIGERAGNAALEELIMTLETRKDAFGFKHGVDTQKIYSTSRCVSEATGMEVSPNKAIVGRNAFAHESGIHQDGMLKNQETYEIIRPETVGAPSTKLVMGKLSGRRALQFRLRKLGYELDGEKLKEAFTQFKALADQRKQVTDADLVSLMRNRFEGNTDKFRLARLEVTSRTDAACSAYVSLYGPQTRLETTATGPGSIDAVFAAIDRILRSGFVLSDYQLKATGEGTQAVAEARVDVRGQDGQPYRGFGSDQDSTVASAIAYLSAQNKAIAATSDLPMYGEAS